MHLLHQEEENKACPKRQGAIVQETPECASRETSCMLSGHIYMSARTKFNILLELKKDSLDIISEGHLLNLVLGEFQSCFNSCDRKYNSVPETQEWEYRHQEAPSG